MTQTDRCRTGISGLDHLTGGGLPRRRLYLVRGRPGTGKTTLGLQFLLEGVANGESGLYITLSETREELEVLAASHGWTLAGVTLIDLSAIEQQLKPEAQTTLLQPSELELARTARVLQQTIEQARPDRIVFDSLAEFRLMAQNPLRYRRQILAFKTFLSSHLATVLMLDDQIDNADHQLESIAHGVIHFDTVRPDFGAEQRRVAINKLRGVAFPGGFHDYSVETGGIVIYPRLTASRRGAPLQLDREPSGITALDELLHGGLVRGTSTLVMGPAGTGKSTIALQYAVQAARRGARAAVFAFDEGVSTLFARAAGLRIPLREYVEKGSLQVQRIDPAELSAGQFASLVSGLVENGVETVVIDSLNGFLQAMPSERYLVIHLHELLSYLAQRGVSTVLTLAEHGIIGKLESPVDLSYLADTVLMLRYFEHAGAVRKGISVMKNRASSHEDTIRELQLVDGRGIVVGEPLKAFRGLLSGVPTFAGEDVQMLTRNASAR
jgi:circadian clock protein KaiC